MCVEVASWAGAEGRPRRRQWRCSGLHSLPWAAGFWWLGVDFVPWSVIHRRLSAGQEPAGLLCLLCLKVAASDQKGELSVKAVSGSWGFVLSAGTPQADRLAWPHLSAGIYRASSTFTCSLSASCSVLPSWGHLLLRHGGQVPHQWGQKSLGIFRLRPLWIWRRAEEEPSPWPPAHDVAFELLRCSGRPSRSGLASPPRAVVLAAT